MFLFSDSYMECIVCVNACIDTDDALRTMHSGRCTPNLSLLY